MVEAANIAAVLLAAGTSQRFGTEDKLLASLAGEPLALHAARRIVELAPGRRIAVCPNRDGVLAQQLAAEGFEIAVNPYPERGLSHSLSRGIAEAALGPEVAALICLADMPFVSTSHLRELLARFDPSTAPVVASSDGDTAMPPALFASALFNKLLTGEGDRGGKALLAGAALVHAAADELLDIDRPGDLPAR
ncbi:molybdenum cofactor cytidylyltransferase [Sphingopyxis sp. OAS728]|uniref:nucleotidyltransferase family protein n=1 Tax=Sphingopyxis sp. OAS728 TaxID=2663823 RepID=UPI00178B674F|nr:nucleotidyltransferase family protein [Sphingopyxis sp. OAS728]MBE1530005.1 molybdenum cofactor cytidylyltransferase [Sphingopyxis sp. OAS728]